MFAGKPSGIDVSQVEEPSRTRSKAGRIQVEHIVPERARNIPALVRLYCTGSDMKKLLTEFIGTFFLVLTIGLVVAANNPAGVIAIGISLMVMVYMGGHISGGHYNPAVSTAALIAKKMEAKDYVPYVLSQIIGAVAAAFASYYMVGKSFPVAPGPMIGTGQALLVEVLYTFALVLVVLNVACSKKTAGNSYYGLAIGGTIMAAAYAGGGISGGAFNPAVGLGPTIVHATVGGGNYTNVWLYILGPILGAGLAAMVFNIQETEAPAE